MRPVLCQVKSSEEDQSQSEQYRMERSAHGEPDSGAESFLGASLPLFFAEVIGALKALLLPTVEPWNAGATKNALVTRCAACIPRDVPTEAGGFLCACVDVEARGIFHGGLVQIESRGDCYRISHLTVDS